MVWFLVAAAQEGEEQLLVVMGDKVVVEDCGEGVIEQQSDLTCSWGCRTHRQERQTNRQVKHVVIAEV